MRWGKGAFLKLSIIKINEKKGDSKDGYTNRKLSTLASSHGLDLQL